MSLYHSIEEIKTYLINLQNKLCSAFTGLEPKQIFLTDNWTYPSGGGGCSRVLEGGSIFERGGINFSHVNGTQLPSSSTLKRPHLAGSNFQALGLSLVLHPKNPYVPTVHLNLRFFIATQKDGSYPPIWWFGGGMDLTPYYGFLEDCVHWHQTLKNLCDLYDIRLYPILKQECDEYFYLPHRKEARGIGGIFFDDFNKWSFTNCFKFVQAIGNSFLAAYMPIVLRRKDHKYGANERDFQCYRRGRYTEFNLLYDRGTLFGIQSGGRTESILISMPPVVHWKYNWHPSSLDKGSAELSLYETFLPARDWAGIQITS